MLGHQIFLSLVPLILPSLSHTHAHSCTHPHQPARTPTHTHVLTWAHTYTYEVFAFSSETYNCALTQQSSECTLRSAELCSGCELNKNGDLDYDRRSFVVVVVVVVFVIIVVVVVVVIVVVIISEKRLQI